MATAALVITAVAAVGGAIQQRKISKAQKRQNQISNKVAAISRRRNIKRAIAQSRIRTAEIQSIGFQLGVSGGTAVQGAAGSITADTASAIGASNLQFTGQESIANLSDRISDAQSAQATFGAVSAIAGQFTGAQGAQNTAAIQSLV